MYHFLDATKSKIFKIIIIIQIIIIKTSSKVEQYISTFKSDNIIVIKSPYYAKI